MRFKIHFKIDKIPMPYNIMFHSIIKQALRSVNEDYYKELYEAEIKQTKNFSSSLKVNNYKIVNGEMIVNGDVVLYISTPDNKLALTILNGFMLSESFRYKEYIAIKTNIAPINQKEITNSGVILRAESPVIIQSKERKALKVGTDEYIEALNYISNLSLKNYRGYGLKEHLGFAAINTKDVICKLNFKDAVERTGNDFIYAQGMKGTFVLTGDKQDLNDLVSLGLGIRKSTLFGYITVV